MKWLVKALLCMLPLCLLAQDPIKVGGNQQQKKLVKMVKPVYPPEAKAAGIQGVVRLEAVIDRDGKVSTLDIAGGPEELIPATMEAVRQWEYEPTLLNGERVAVRTTIDVNYTLAK